MALFYRTSPFPFPQCSCKHCPTILAVLNLTCNPEGRSRNMAYITASFLNSAAVKRTFVHCNSARLYGKSLRLFRLLLLENLVVVVKTTVASWRWVYVAECEDVVGIPCFKTNRKYVFVFDENIWTKEG
jgi:hypothetical protein